MTDTTAKNLHTFKARTKSPMDMKMFLDDEGSVDISRSDLVKNPIFEKQAERMFDAMWRFAEINLTKDKYDFYHTLSETDQFIFTSNIKRQIVLDTLQSKGLVLALLPLASDPMIKRCINIITFFEELHNMTYEHIVKNVYNDPTEVMNGIYDIVPIITMATDIGSSYDNAIDMNAKYRLGMVDQYEVKKALWMVLHEVNALEGIRFFGSFVPSFGFGQTGRMVGNSSEIRLIANDELMHQAFTTAIIRRLPKDDPDFIRIEEECREAVYKLFMSVIESELAWVDHIFQHGTMIGVNGDILKDFILFRAAKCMNAVFVTPRFDHPKASPLPWMSHWLNESDVQVANQETENTSYTLSMQNDLETGSFKGIEL